MRSVRSAGTSGEIDHVTVRSGCGVLCTTSFTTLSCCDSTLRTALECGRSATHLSSSGTEAAYTTNGSHRRRLSPLPIIPVPPPQRWWLPRFHARDANDGSEVPDVQHRGTERTEKTVEKLPSPGSNLILVRFESGLI